MKKVLYVNGCSHSCGSEISYPGSHRTATDIHLCWGGQLARTLNLQQVNHASNGQSNQSIYSTTIHGILELLQTTKPEEILVVIGWSSFDRKEMIYDNKVYPLIPGIADMPFFKEWPQIVQDALKTHLMSLDYINVTPNEFSLIYFSLVNFLKMHGIDYLFFNAINGLSIPKKNLLHKHFNDAPTQAIFDQIANDPNYLHPYNNDMAYYRYLQKDYDCFKDNRNHHFTEDAHIAWADILAKKLTP